MPVPERTLDASRIVAAILGLALLAQPAAARPLDQIKESGTMALCAHPNALPFSAKDGDRHGFQVELAEALAKALGVTLETNWVITGFDRNRTDCDLVIDAIADAEAQAESRLGLSKPYRRSGVVLAVRADNATIASLADLNAAGKIGILPGSFAAMVLGKRGVHTSPAPFEDELLGEVASGELAGAAVTPTAVGYYNLRHADKPMKPLDLFAAEPDLTWNVAIGMVKADQAFTAAIDAALDKLVADGTIKTIYARYGIELLPPR